MWTVNHPEQRRKVEGAAGAALRDVQTAVWRQKLQRDEVKEGRGWVRWPERGRRGTRPRGTVSKAPGGPGDFGQG